MKTTFLPRLSFVSLVLVLTLIPMRNMFSQQIIPGFNVYVQNIEKIPVLNEPTGTISIVNGRLQYGQRQVFPKDSTYTFISFQIIFEPTPTSTSFRLPEKSLALENLQKELFYPLRSESFQIQGDSYQYLTVTDLGNTETVKAKNHFISNNISSGLDLTFEIKNTDKHDELYLLINDTLIGDLTSLKK